MATTDWQIPTGKEITGATYIKDTDDKIAATIEDLVDWCNNANGTYNDWTLTGLRTDFVDVNTAQTITAVKTIDTLGAVDFTGGELRIGGTAVTSTAAELNTLDGITATVDELNVLDGIPATLTATELGYLDGVTGSIQTQIDNVVEVGINENGRYIKFADGMLICTTQMSTSSSADTTWTFPVSFSTTTDLVYSGSTYTAGTTAATFVSFGSTTSTLLSVYVSAYNTSGSRVVAIAKVTAIGRWN